MRKILQLTAIILVLGGILFLRPMQATALEPGVYPVPVGTECLGLNNVPIFDPLVFNYGYKVEGTTNGQFYFTDLGGGIITGAGQLEDPSNSVTLSGNATTFTWSASLGIDAVIVHGATQAFAYYYSPESGGASGLGVGSTGEAISSIEVCFDYELQASATANTAWYKFIDWSIAKSANAASAAAFAGAAPNLTYTIDLTKAETLGPYEISGSVTVTNPSPYEAPTTPSAAVGGTPLSITCSPATIPANSSATCNYSGNLNNSDPGTVNFTFTVNTPSFLFGTNTSRGYSFGAATLLPGSDPETVTLTDTQAGNLGPFSSTASPTYTAKTTCSSNPGSYTAGRYSTLMENTATITKPNPESASLSIPLECYAPQVTKSATATAYKTVDWTISKGVDQASQNRLAGEGATFNYTISLDKTETPGPFVVEGIISVANPTGAPGNMNVSVSDAPGGVAATVDCDPTTVGDQATLSVPPSLSRDCTYKASLVSATNGSNIATVSLNGASFTASASYTFGAPQLSPNSEPDSVTVTDSFAGTFGPYSGDATIPYPRTATCPFTPLTYVDGHAVVNLANTASINGTQDAPASAPAALHCYAPVVSKSAAGTYAELHTWSLSKAANPPTQHALAGQAALYTWQIQVNETVTEQEFAVDGAIQVANPGPLPMTVVLSDRLSDNTLATINSCTNGTLTGSSLSIAAGATASCTYSAAPNGRLANANTATATLNGIAFSASASLGWTPEAINPSVTLDDDQNPAFPLEITQGGSYSYVDSHTCSTTPASYTAGKYTFGESNTVTLKAGAVTVASTSANATVDCYAPTLSKNASASYTERHTWTLAKNANPQIQSVFAGQTASYTWNIEVTEEVTEEAFAVAGEIRVTNPAPVPMTVSLGDTLSDGTPAAIGPCSGGTLTGGALTLPANTTAVCEYLAEPAGRTATTNTATLSMNGFSLSAGASLTWVATLVDPSVTLNDDQNPNLPQALDGSAIISYRKEHACPVDPAAYINGLAAFSESNTAVLTLPTPGAPEITADASVAVDCYGPVVSKTAEASYTAEHTWTLDKSVSPTSQKAFAGQPAPFTWTVTVGHQAAETGFLVTGKITITNPSGEAMHVGLTDAVGDSTQATITGCSIANGKITIPSKGTVVCDYTARPPDRSATTNTAVVTLNGVEFSAGHALDWVATATNPTVTLDDERNPAFPVELTEGGIFTYAETPACPVDPALYIDGFFTFAALNTATLTALPQDGGEAIIIASDSATFSVDCYAPMVSKTAAGTTYKGINWFITKTAAQPSAAGLAGGNATLHYTLALDKQVESELHLVEGEITITSPLGAPADMPLTVTDLVVPTGLNTVPATVDCDTATPGNQDSISLAPGAQHVCTYTASLASPTGGTNTAFVGLPPQPGGQGVYFSDTVDYVFGTTDLSKSEPEEITVTDSLAGNLGPFSASTTFNYTAEAACPTDPSAYASGPALVTIPNTARINETFNDESSASVQLTCYAPTLSKTAVATAYKSVNWSILKSAKQSGLAAFAGQSVTFDYTVTLTKNEESGLNVVEGVISVSSPADAPAEMALTVADLVQPTGLAPVPAAVDCDPVADGDQPSLALTAGASAACTYYAELPSATNGVNTVTVTLPPLPPQIPLGFGGDEGGVTFSYTVPYTFGEQVEGLTEPETVTVTDSLAGDLGEFTASASKDYTYTATCPTTQASYPNGHFTRQITNTARINETQDAPVSATVTLDCYAPLVSKTASAVAYESIDWTLDKVGIQPPSGGFAGGVVLFDYQLTATKTITPGPFEVSGAISLANPADAPGALVLRVTDELIPGGQAAIPVTADCRPLTPGDQAEVTLDPGESATCTYLASLPGAVDGTNTAAILFSPPSGWEQGGVAFTASANYAFGDPVPAQGSEPSTITVVDGLDGWTTSETKTFNLTRPQACPADPAAYTDGYFSTPVSNTASIFGTGDTDTVTLLLECYAAQATNVATTTAYTTLDWSLVKTANPVSLGLFAGQSQEVEYTLDLALNQAHGPFLVMGTITVFNSDPEHPLAATVTDVVGGVPADVDCDPLTDGDQPTLTIPAGGTGACAYLAHLPAAVDGISTATITTPPIPGGAGGVFTAEAPYTFGPPQLSEMSEPAEVRLADSLGGSFGPFTAGDIVTYTAPAACPVDPAAYQQGVYAHQVTNTAMILTMDGEPLTGQGNQSGALVDVTCYAPLASKTAAATWTKTIDWTLSKTVAPLSADLLAGETADFAYTLVLEKLETPGAYTVSGAVSLTNPAGAPGALALSVVDILKPTGQADIPVTLDCDPQAEGDQAEVTLEPGESVSCTYTVELEGPFDGMNTATLFFSPPSGGDQGGVNFTLSTPYAFGEAVLLPGSEPETVRLWDVFDGQPEDLGSFSQADELTYTRTLGCPADPAAYLDGFYSYTRTNTARLMTADGGLPTGDEATQAVTVNCTLPGSPAQVVKILDQGSQAIGQFPIQFALYPPGATEPVETISLNAAEVTGDGQYTLPFQTLVTAGTWTVEELLPVGWKSAQTTCTLEVPEVVASGDPFTCTFTNTELSRLRLLKTTNGQVDPSRDWQFILLPPQFPGEIGGVGGDGWLDFGLLDPAQAYTVCELNVEKNWASVWSVGGVIVPGYYLNGLHCVDIGPGTPLPLQPGETLALHVDNVSTLGAPGSSGYWKNSPELEALLSRYTFTIGALQLGGGGGLSSLRLSNQASMVVLLLEMRDLGTGKKMASDVAYQLASELLVYRLNQAKGACVRPEAEAVANAAQALLLSLDFDGRGAYMRHPEAVLKAGALARYNNGSCGK